MNKEFIPYEQALELKQLGFDEDCLAFYIADKNKELETILRIDKVERQKLLDASKNFNEFIYIYAPLYQQAFRFFREKYGCSGIVEGSKKDGYEWCIYPDEDFYVKNPNNSNTYEEAEHACLLKLIELAKKK